MLDFRAGVPVYWSELEVVSRRVNVPPAQVQDLLLDPAVLPPDDRFDLDGLGTWRLDQPFVRDEWSGDSSRARGRLVRTEHRLQSCRIVLDVVTWSANCCELRVHPATRHIEWWTARKQRRYFAMAHLCADDIVRRLCTAARVRTQRQSCDVGEPSLVLVGGRA